MPKQVKRIHINEDKYDKLHKEMNMVIGPTRKEDLPGSYPVYLIPNLDLLQKQVNRIENTVNHEARCARRRAWRK